MTTDTARLSDVAREGFCTAFSKTRFVMFTRLIITRLAIQLGALAATKCLPSGLSSFKNKFAGCDHLPTIHDVLEELFS